MRRTLECPICFKSFSVKLDVENDSSKCPYCGCQLISCLGCGATQLAPNQSPTKITIEIRNGCLVDVKGLPPGVTYELIDWDDINAEEDEDMERLAEDERNMMLQHEANERHRQEEGY